MRPGALRAGWLVAGGAAIGVRAWNALAGPLMWGYDAWGHLAYVFFLDRFHAVPWADQGWSYFHPPLHYVLGLGLAQFGSGEALLRGLSILGSAASLGIAALAALLARWACPARPGLALLAFSAVAFLPVHLNSSPMPGNELTADFISAAAIALLIANERRTRPAFAADAGVGLLIGLALLTKFSGAIALVTVGSVFAIGFLRESRSGFGRAAVLRLVGRGAIVGGIAVALSGPYYARNVAEFGTPFQLSRDFALVSAVESQQPPGERALRDFVAVSPRLFSDPDPLAPHLVRSVWGSTYLNMWSDSFRAWTFPPKQRNDEIRIASSVLALLGLIPTLLAVAGALLALRDVRAGRRVFVYTPLLCLAAVTLAVYTVFAWRVPIYSATKASYLFNLSLPYGVFLARSVEALVTSGRRAAPRAAVAGVAIASAVAAVIFTAGAIFPRLIDSEFVGAVHFQVGDYEKARKPYSLRMGLFGARGQTHWIENLAAVELARGNAALAQRLYARAAARHPGDPYRANRLAVAMALAGDPAAAAAELDRASADDPLPELLANRGALRALAGDRSGAETDLREAVARTPRLVPAWWNLAAVLDSEGRAEDAAAARRQADAMVCRAPRDYPYGLGTGELLDTLVVSRWLLKLEDGGLAPALPTDFRRRCRD
jgi:tetratricopeptide (TPR) repeat protein